MKRHLRSAVELACAATAGSAAATCRVRPARHREPVRHAPPAQRSGRRARQAQHRPTRALSGPARPTAARPRGGVRALAGGEPDAGRDQRHADGVVAARRFAQQQDRQDRVAEHALAAGVPFSWVAADTVYDVGEVEMALRRTGKGYVSASPARTASTPGACCRLSRARRTRSRRTCRPPRSGASRRARARRARACTTGPSGMS